MALVLLRVWLPDRPGALGQVASRIGALRGDVVGIDILERGAGRVVDELVVELPDDVADDLFVREVCEVDGVDVEDVRILDDGVPDPRIDVLDDAVGLVEASDQLELLAAFVHGVRVRFAGDWALVVDHDAASIAAMAGQAIPPVAWLAAFCRGVRGHPASADVLAAGDLVCVPVATGPTALLVSRPGHPFRSRERRQLVALTVIVAARLQELEPTSDTVTRHGELAGRRQGSRILPARPVG